MSNDCKEEVQKITFEVTVSVYEEPLMDDHDIAIVSSLIAEAIDALEWNGIVARAEPT